MEYGVKNEDTGMMDSSIDHTAANDISPIKRLSSFNEYHALSDTMVMKDLYRNQSDTKNYGFILVSLAINLISS
jgi:hypothetical protein